MPTVLRKGDPHHQEAFVSKWGFFPLSASPAVSEPGRDRSTGKQDLNPIEARGQVLTIPQHLRFIGAGGIAAPRLWERERTLRPLPFWRFSSLSPLIASTCASQMMRDERDRPLPAGQGMAAGAGPCPRTGGSSRLVATLPAAPFLSPLLAPR